MPNEDQCELTPADRELEAALRGLRPADAGVDPLVIAYRAGAARRQASLWAWRAAAAVLAVALGVAALSAQREDASEKAPPTLAVAPPPALITVQPSATPSYRLLRQRVIEHGLDALAMPVGGPTSNDKPAPRAGDNTWRPL